MHSELHSMVRNFVRVFEIKIIKIKKIWYKIVIKLPLVNLYYSILLIMQEKLRVNGEVNVLFKYINFLKINKI